jgi:hypothetical protein
MEFNTYSSRSKHLPLLIYWHALWSSSIFFSLFTVCCASINHIMFKHIHLYVIFKKKRTSLLFSHLCISIVFVCVCVVTRNYRPVCIMAFWWSHHKRKENDNQVSEKVSSATLPSHLFIVIEINKKNMMIDSGHRWQITNAHKTSEPMIIAIRLCTHRILPHHTKVYSGICGPLNWLCIFFLILIWIFFSHVMWNINPLDFSQSSTQTDICLAIIDNKCLCRHFSFVFSRKRCRSI